MALHISISAESIFAVGPLHVTNSMLLSLVASGVLIALAVAVRLSLKKTNRPTGLQNFAEMIVDMFSQMTRGITHNEKKTNEIAPFIAAFFLFILTNNWLGLVPGVGTIGFYEHEESEAVVVKQTRPLPFVSQVQAKEEVVEEKAEVATHETSEPIFLPYFRAGTADLNMTLALGLISVFLIQFFGVRYQHLGYFGKFINLSNPINFFVGLLEIVSEFSRIISFAFRLFGNVFAGEVLLVVISSLTKVIAPMPFYGMEIFVGFIQALVFAMLSLVLMSMATAGHKEH